MLQIMARARYQTLNGGKKQLIAGSKATLGVELLIFWNIFLEEFTGYPQPFWSGDSALVTYPAFVSCEGPGAVSFYAVSLGVT